MPHPLSNPYPAVPASPDEGKLWGRVSAECYNYFFRGVFAGERGVTQCLVNSLMAKLHAECLRREIEGVWSPENMNAVAKVLEDLNFNEVPQVKPKTKKTKI